MPKPTCKIAAIFQKALITQAHVRPYENKSSVNGGIDIKIFEQALPETGHHRVELVVKLTGINSEDVLCYEALAHFEAIIIYENLDEKEVSDMMSIHFPGLLLAHIRPVLDTAMTQMGYNGTRLPPISGVQLKQMASKGSLEPELSAESLSA